MKYNCNRRSFTNHKYGVVYLSSRKIEGRRWQNSRENTPDIGIVSVYFCRVQLLTPATKPSGDHENLRTRNKYIGLLR